MSLDFQEGTADLNRVIIATGKVSGCRDCEREPLVQLHYLPAVGTWVVYLTSLNLFSHFIQFYLFIFRYV